MPNIPFPKENVGGVAGNIMDKVQELKIVAKIKKECAQTVLIFVGIIILAIIIYLNY